MEDQTQQKKTDNTFTTSSKRFKKEKFKRFTEDPVSTRQDKEMKSQLAPPQYFPYINEKIPTPNEPSSKILKPIRPDSCLTQKTQNLIKISLQHINPHKNICID